MPSPYISSWRAIHTNAPYRFFITHFILRIATNHFSFKPVVLRDFEIPKPARLAQVSPCTHKIFIPSAHALRTGCELATLFICTLTLSSISLVRISGCGGPPTSLLARLTSGVSQGWSTCSACGDEELVTAVIAAWAPPQFLWPTTTAASGQTGY